MGKMNKLGGSGFHHVAIRVEVAQAKARELGFSTRQKV